MMCQRPALSHRACNEDVVKALVSYRVDVNIKDKESEKTPLHVAACLDRSNLLSVFSALTQVPSLRCVSSC